MAIKTPKQREQEQRKLFRPYANELGWLVFEWNRLQEALSELFAIIIAPKHHSLGIGIWHSIANDRAQREMLAAANTALTKKLGTKAAADIKWLLDRVRGLADQRNTAIHSPLVFVIEPDQGLLLMPLFFLGNPRAAKLRDKDLLNEFACIVHERAH